MVPIIVNRSYILIAFVRQHNKKFLLGSKYPFVYKIGKINFLKTIFSGHFIENNVYCSKLCFTQLNGIHYMLYRRWINKGNQTKLGNFRKTSKPLRKLTSNGMCSSLVVDAWRKV